MQPSHAATEGGQFSNSIVFVTYTTLLLMNGRPPERLCIACTQ
ncbi:MAG: hypothetical protein N2235_22465 [Fischerella sp.]|nr:hypothetical protein [Fischerella sp.]